MYENDLNVRNYPHVSSLSENGTFSISWSSIDMYMFYFEDNGGVILRHPWDPFTVNFVGFHAEYESLKFLLVFSFFLHFRKTDASWEILSKSNLVKKEGISYFKQDVEDRTTTISV